jgi:hypothetical protein
MAQPVTWIVGVKNSLGSVKQTLDRFAGAVLERGGATWG